MIDSRKIERFNFEIEECIREYHKAKNKVKELYNEVLNKSLNDLPISDALKNQILDCEWEMDYNLKQLETVKQKYIDAIASIKILEL